MGDSPLSTMTGNALAKGTADTAHRDMMGDSLDGPMGTHIGNSQSLASNMQSDYNKMSMSDVQKNMAMIDATRGYGAGSGHDSGDYIYSMTMESSGHAMDMKDTSAGMGMSTDPYDNSRFQGVSPSMFQRNDIGINNGVNQGTLVGGSGYNYGTSNMDNYVSAHNYGGVPNTNERQEFVKIESNIMKKSTKKSRINTALISDVTTKAVTSNATVAAITSQKGENQASGQKISKTKSSSEIAEEENEKFLKEQEKKAKVSNEKSTGVASLRPVVQPKHPYSVKKKTENENTNKNKLMNKLQMMNDDDFVALVEKIGSIKEIENPREKIIHSCKLSILQSEAKRRFEGFVN